MTEIRMWLTSVVLCTMLLSLLKVLVPQGSVRQMCSFSGGLLLLFCTLSPLQHLDFAAGNFFDAERQELLRCQTDLEEYMAAQLEERIAEKTEAYISDKAAEFGIRVTARTELRQCSDGTVLPDLVWIDGNYHAGLSACISKDLGIPAERQVWNESS